jgi:hypothetical protein
VNGPQVVGFRSVGTPNSFDILSGEHASVCSGQVYDGKPAAGGESDNTEAEAANLILLPLDVDSSIPLSCLSSSDGTMSKRISIRLASGARLMNKTNL